MGKMRGVSFLISPGPTCFRPGRTPRPQKCGKDGQAVRRDGRRGGAFVCDTVPRVAPPCAVFPALVFVRRAPPPPRASLPPLRRPPARRPSPSWPTANGNNQKEINKASDARWTTTRAGGGSARDHDARAGMMRGGDARRTTTSTRGTASHMNAQPPSAN